jgi:hypothetical protein
MTRFFGALCGASSGGGGGGGGGGPLILDEQFPDASTDALVARLTNPSGAYDTTGGEGGSGNVSLVTLDSDNRYNGKPTARFSSADVAATALATNAVSPGLAAIYQRAIVRFPSGMLDAFIAVEEGNGENGWNEAGDGALNILVASVPLVVGDTTYAFPMQAAYFTFTSDPDAFTNQAVIGTVDESGPWGGPDVDSNDSVSFADFFATWWEVILLSEQKYDGSTSSTVRGRLGIRHAGSSDPLILLADANGVGITDFVNGGGLKGFSAFQLAPYLTIGSDEDTTNEYANIALWQVADALTQGDLWNAGFTPDPDSSVAP